MANIINGTDTGSGGLITTGDSSDELQLQTAETARVTLTNTAVVVNEGGEDVDFRVEGDTDANLLFVDASTDRVGVGTNTPGDELEIYASNSTPRLRFTGASSVASGVQIGLVDSINGVITNTENGYLLFGTNNTERIRILSSGGITFNGDTAAANALDDYEEGTFTATLTPEASGTITINSGVDLLAYTKIGRVVFIQGLLEVQSVGSPTGTAVALGGLPFTTADLTEYAGRSGGATYVSATTAGAFGITIFETATIAGIVVPANTIQAGTQFYVQFNYIAA